MQSTACSKISIEGRRTYKVFTGTSALADQLREEALNYELHIDLLLIRIRHTRLGAILLAEIEQWGGKNWDKVTICRAAAGVPAQPYLTIDTAPVLAAPLGKPFAFERRTGIGDSRHKIGEWHPQLDDRSAPPDNPLGLGMGSDAVILFDPQTGGMNSFPAQIYRGANQTHHLEGDGHYYELIAWQEDEGLIHELIHALRILQGQWYQAVLGKEWMQRYQDIEEFYGILITNIYLSEKGHSILRGDHHQGALPQSENSSKLFLRHKDNLRLVKELSRTSPSLFNQIAHVRPLGGFNPIREYVINQSSYD
jgi:hypothetical protein